MPGADLHIHSIWSDGLTSPPEIARQVREARLSYVSLTDHNILNGVEVLVRCLEDTDVEVITGVEMTTADDDLGEVHILGYGIDTANAPLRAALRSVMERKRQQLARMMDGLMKEGIEIGEDGVREQPGPGYVGRLALARVLVRKGGARSIYHAFSRYLGEEGKLYSPLSAMNVGRAIDLIHQAGGLAVLAHPTIDMLDAAIRRYDRLGLDGIEVYRASSGGNEELYAEMLAEDFGLVMTGGSDWHGRRSHGPIGRFRVDEEKIAAFLQRLHVAAGQ
jgi:hypothetical protein